MAFKKVDHIFEVLITYFESMGKSEDYYSFLLGSENNLTKEPDTLFRLN